MYTIEKLDANTYVIMNVAKRVGIAGVHPQDNYIVAIRIEPAHQRKGLATMLIDYIIADRGGLNKAPEHTKNNAIKSLAPKIWEKYGDKIGPEQVWRVPGE